MSHINVSCFPYSFSSSGVFWSEISSTGAKDKCTAYNSKNTEKDLYPTAKADFFGGESNFKKKQLIHI